MSLSINHTYCICLPSKDYIAQDSYPSLPKNLKAKFGSSKKVKPSKALLKGESISYKITIEGEEDKVDKLRIHFEITKNNFIVSGNFLDSQNDYQHRAYIVKCDKTYQNCSKIVELPAEDAYNFREDSIFKSKNRLSF